MTTIGMLNWSLTFNVVQAMTILFLVGLLFGLLVAPEKTDRVRKYVARLVGQS